ncbi:MAG: peptidylprolyl isomerase [Candidatus Cloacimonadota bacterium]|nr:MAG: peptidylprolyl isomerase [Candidatus Cloacimonadota bacterium]
MKRALLIIIALLILVSLSAEVVDKIIAKVGKEIILKSDLEKRMQQLNASGTAMNDITQFDILNDMIEAKLIIQKAKEEEYKVDDQMIKEMAEDQIKQVASQFPSELEFKKELRGAGLSVPDLKDYYIEMMTEEQLKSQIIRHNIKSKIHITEGEVEEYYKENLVDIPPRPEMYKIGMIVRFIKAGKDTKEKVLVEINKIRDKVNEGADFAELAKEYSDGPSAANGGNLGFFGKGMMVKPFETAAFALMPGEISEVIETQFGYHIIKVLEKKGNEVNASHILKIVEATEEDVQANIQLMEGVLQKLADGEEFTELAKTYSEDEESAIKGGVIGEFTKDTFPEIFKKHLENLEVGGNTELIREQESLYIFSILKKIPEREYRYTEIFDRLKEMVTSQKEIELYGNWIKELMHESYVEILIEE